MFKDVLLPIKENLKVILKSSTKKIVKRMVEMKLQDNNEAYSVDEVTGISYQPLS